MTQPSVNAQEILAKGIARAKELAAKLAKNAPPSSSTTTKRPLDRDYSAPSSDGHRSQSGFVSQEDAYGSFKRQALGGGGNYLQSYGTRAIDETMIPSSMVGLIIGRGGETLKSIQAQAGNVRIQIDKENIGNQRRVNFTGAREAIEEAKRLIQSKIGESQQQASHQQQHQQSLYPGQPSAGNGPATGNYGPTEEVERIAIPSNKVGLVIGTRGATLRDLQDQSGARIQIDRDHEVTNPNERQVAIHGTAEQISQAKALLEQLVNGGPGAGRSSSGASNLPTMIINVPGDMVGLVIGRGGETIKNIQQMSGCNVKIDQNNGAPIRTITVTGQQENLRYAEEMIQDKVQGNGQIVSGGSGDGGQPEAAAAAAPAGYYGAQQQSPVGAPGGYSAADYSAYYDQSASSAANSAQAYADYYAQYYSQQQPPTDQQPQSQQATTDTPLQQVAGVAETIGKDQSSKTPQPQQKPSDEALAVTIKEAATAAAAAAGATDAATLAYYQQYYEQYYTSYYAQQQQQTDAQPASTDTPAKDAESSNESDNNSNSQE